MATEAREAMVIGSSESGLTVREAILAMLEGHFTSLGFKDPLGGGLFYLFGEVLDLCEELKFNPRFVINWFAAELESDPPPRRAVMWLGQKLTKLKACLEHQVRMAQIG